MKCEVRGEKIRAWYDRTTERYRLWLYGATAVAVPSSILFFLAVPELWHAKLQVFNGAVTIPVAAAIWIAAFVFIFLVPSRECGFRSVESVERTEEKMTVFVEKTVPDYWERDVKPVLQVWKRLGERLEAKLDEERLEHLVFGLEKFLSVPGTGDLPNPSAGMKAFRESRRLAAAGDRKKEDKGS